ncbi:CMGC/CDK/CDK4 protein kinase [Aphelenchoides besseyi]|nr:CMGC/CDK/CDK4 protein kinase [Aphelenchoides besseyi]KAI6202304.1 CMGC/CDK/CDK4 protein kinase [Aphelenchoides besseyi]
MSLSKRPRVSNNFPRIVKNYQVQNEIGRGAYGCVYIVTNMQTKVKFALKRITMKPSDEGIPQSVIREISTLKALGFHKNITRFYDAFALQERSGLNSLNVVFEKCDCDLNDFMRRQRDDLPLSKICEIMREIFEGLDFLHTNSVIHRDIKPQNILINNDKYVKIADFGLSRNYGLHTTFSPEVVTLWYRSPELLLRCKYNTTVDIWSAGCIFAELHSKKPLFLAPSEARLLLAIFEWVVRCWQQNCVLFRKIGTPEIERWPVDSVIGHNFFKECPPIPFSNLVPRMSVEATNLIQQILQFNSEKRPTARECLDHQYFTSSSVEPVLPTVAN